MKTTVSLNSERFNGFIDTTNQIQALLYRSAEQPSILYFVSHHMVLVILATNGNMYNIV